MKTLYSDERNLINGWLRYLLVGIFIVVAILILVSYFVDFSADWFHKPDKITTVLLVLFMIVLTIFVMVLKVKIEIDAVTIRMKCLTTHEYKKKKIVNAEIVTVNPIVDYGGYGYRVKHGERAYIPDDCRTGVRVTFKEGPAVFIASMEPERLLRAIRGQN